MGQIVYKNNKLKLPFSSGYVLQNYSTAEKGIIDAFKNGYDYWYIDCSLVTESHKQWNVTRIKQLQHLIQSYGVYPIIHGNFKLPLSSDIDELRSTAIEYVKYEIDLAANLSAPLIVHGGAVIEPRLIRKVKVTAIKNFLSSLNILQEYAVKKNVQLYLENLSNYKNYSPFHYIFTYEEEFDFIFSSIDIPFFLDLGHANIGNPSPNKIFKKYSDRIVGMSFSNNNSVKDQHLSLNKGTINYIEILNSIETIGWKGFIAFETRDKSPDKNIEELNQLFYANKINKFSIEPNQDFYAARG